MHDGEERFALPRPKRGAWVVVAAVGAATALFGAQALVDAPLDGLPIAYVALGAGLFLSFFAAAMLTMRERPAVVSIGRDDLAIETLAGEVVRLPWSSLRQAVAMPHQQGQQSVIALRKADGGWVELATYRDEPTAGRLVERLQRAIDEAAESEGPSPSPVEALPGVTIFREGERTTWAWSTTSFGGLLALGPLLGMVVAIYGFHRNQPSMGTLAAMGFMAALATIMVVFTLVNVGAKQQVVVDAEAMTVRRTRLGRVVSDQRLPLATIAAVDYTHRLNVLGASSLILRTDRVRLAGERAERQAAEAADAPDDVDALALGASLLEAFAGGVHVPLGRLPLASRVGLDLALSDAIAQRTGRAKGTV